MRDQKSFRQLPTKISKLESKKNPITVQNNLK